MSGAGCLPVPPLTENQRRMPSKITFSVTPMTLLFSCVASAVRNGTKRIGGTNHRSKKARDRMIASTSHPNLLLQLFGQVSMIACSSSTFLYQRKPPKKGEPFVGAGGWGYSFFLPDPSSQLGRGDDEAVPSYSSTSRPGFPGRLASPHSAYFGESLYQVGDRRINSSTFVSPLSSLSSRSNSGEGFRAGSSV